VLWVNQSYSSARTTPSRESESGTVGLQLNKFIYLTYQHFRAQWEY